jgi:hypothetical protein
MADLNINALRAVLSIAFDVNAPENKGWINQFQTFAKSLADDNVDVALIPDVILKDPKAMKDAKLKPFFDRFQTFFDISEKDQAGGKPPTYSTIAEYMTAEKTYIRQFQQTPGFEEFATVKNAQDFMKNDVSPDEVKSRIQNALYAVKTADTALRQEINRMFPSANDSDLARVLVTGNIDAATEQIKFAQAGINVAAAGAGLTPASSTEDLAKRGLSREKAAVGFGAVKSQLAGTQLAAQMFGESTEDIQKQLEEEKLFGTPSEKLTGLASQARAQFAGQTGITAGSLSKRKSGQL